MGLTSEEQRREHHRKYNREYNREYRVKNRERLIEAQRRWRKNNPDKWREYHKRWLLKNPNRRILRREYNKQWQKIHPDKEREYRKRYRLKNMDKIREHRRKYLAEKLATLRLAALSHYSGGGEPKCACCGETAQEFLTIHHVNGDGASHRRKLKTLGRGTTMFGIYGWQKRNNYPEGFSVLCWNCNYASRLTGYCPHHPGVLNQKNCYHRTGKFKEIINKESSIAIPSVAPNQSNQILP